MQENASSKKVKLFLFSAILVIVLLLVVSIAEIVNINLKNQQILSQQQEIERLYEQRDYYETQKHDGGGDNLVEEQE